MARLLAIAESPTWSGIALDTEQFSGCVDYREICPTPKSFVYRLVKWFRFLSRLKVSADALAAWRAEAGPLGQSKRINSSQS